MKIACIGDNCVDYYEASGRCYFGGNPVNVAVYAVELGAEASYLGAVGTDRYGQDMLRALKEKQLDLSHVQILEGSTALTHVSLQNGERIFGDYEEGVMRQFVLRPEDLPFLASHDLLVSGLWGHTEHQLQELRSLGIPIAFDFAERPESDIGKIAAPSCDLAFFSDDQSDENALKQRMKSLHLQGPRLVIATRGERGSLAYDGQTYSSYDIVPCQLVDTMGAGDSYIAGFLLAWLQGQPIPDCMARGAAKSAETLAHAAAW